MTSQPKSNELFISRFYEAPVAAVWDAWTDPAKVEKWWGPRGFTLTTHSKDLRAGGHWRYTMHGPDGTDWENHTIYHVVEKHAKLVYDHGGYADRPPLFRVTVTFTEVTGGTRMDMIMALKTAEEAAETRKFIRKAGGEATWDRLAEFLAGQPGGRDIFVINRVFEAPIRVVYSMWTDPAKISRWLPPVGFNMTYSRADVRPGGGTVFSMTAENGGTTLRGRTEYLKLEEPLTVVYTQQFCDEKGNVSRHPMAPVWPETMLTTVRLTEESPGRTRVTVTWEPFGKASAEEIAAFVKMRPSMTQGWTGSFDKLEKLLADGVAV